MSLLHQHRWKRISVTFVAPASHLTWVENADEDWLDRAMFGFTVVVLRCKGCGDEKAHEFRGDVTRDVEAVL